MRAAGAVYLTTDHTDDTDSRLRDGGWPAPSAWSVWSAVETSALTRHRG